MTNAGEAISLRQAEDRSMPVWVDDARHIVQHFRRKGPICSWFTVKDQVY